MGGRPLGRSGCGRNETLSIVFWVRNQKDWIFQMRLSDTGLKMLTWAVRDGNISLSGCKAGTQRSLPPHHSNESPLTSSLYLTWSLSVNQTLHFNKIWGWIICTLKIWGPRGYSKWSRMLEISFFLYTTDFQPLLHIRTTWKTFLNLISKHQLNLVSLKGGNQASICFKTVWGWRKGVSLQQVFAILSLGAASLKSSLSGCAVYSALNFQNILIPLQSVTLCYISFAVCLLFTFL